MLQIEYAFDTINNAEKINVKKFKFISKKKFLRFLSLGKRQ